MVRKRIILIAILAGMSAGAAPPLPPDQVQPTAADLSWLRGRVTDANATDRARWLALRAWAAKCAAQRTAEVRAELAGLGVEATDLPVLAYGDDRCTIVTLSDNILQTYPTWTAFETARLEAQPVFAGFIRAAAIAEGIVEEAPSAALADRLRAMTIGEQLLRKANNWRGSDGKAESLPLSAGAASLFSLLIAFEVEKRDKANTAALKEIVAANGWPSISAVGSKAASSAWLLVQHADNDPAFQLRALRLMEGLLPTSEVRRNNYAYLYDRVMLKLVGRQRYGTQFNCQAGRRKPQPLEEPNRIDEIRKGADLPPLSEYQATMERVFGATC